MGSKDIIAAGSVWDEDPVFDDPIGTFKWRLSVRQLDEEIQPLFTKIKATGGSDTLTESFNADTRMASVPFTTDDGVSGQLIEVASVTLSEGHNGSWGIEGGVEAGVDSDGPSVKGELKVKLDFADMPDNAVWEFRIIATPTADGCPEIIVRDHFTTVSQDSDYFWGDLLESGSGSSDVNHQQPQVYIAPTCREIDPQWMMSNRLPLLTENDITDIRIDTASQF
jgi:hypothetical protein